MHVQSIFHALAALLLLGSSGAMPGASTALAQTRSEAEIRQQYLQDRAACQRNHSGTELQNCLREAGAAQAAALGGELSEEQERYRANALLRCATLPSEYREACRMRIEGHGTTKGSVESGGIYRELVTREVGQPPATPLPPATSVAPPSVTPPLPASPQPAQPQTAPRTPGAPTFTPVQPVLPGRSIAPEPAQTPLQGATPTVPMQPMTPAQPMSPTPGAAPVPAQPSSAPATSLQITPPDTPVLRVPEPIPPPAPAPGVSTQ